MRRDSSGATTIAGSAPADVTTVRIEITGATPIDVETIAFADYPSRFYSTVVTSGAPQAISWLNADGDVVDTMTITLVPPDTEGATPPGPATVPTIAPNRSGASD